MNFFHFRSGSLRLPVLCCALHMPYFFLIHIFQVRWLDLNPYKSTVYKQRSVALSEVCWEKVHGLHPNTHPLICCLGQSLVPLMWVTPQVSLLGWKSLCTHGHTHSNTSKQAFPHGAWCTHLFLPNSLQISTHFCEQLLFPELKNQTGAHHALCMCFCSLSGGAEWTLAP